MICVHQAATLNRVRSATITRDITAPEAEDWNAGGSAVLVETPFPDVATACPVVPEPMAEVAAAEVEAAVVAAAEEAEVAAAVEEVAAAEEAEVAAAEEEVTTEVATAEDAELGAEVATALVAAAEVAAAEVAAAEVAAAEVAAAEVEVAAAEDEVETGGAVVPMGPVVATKNGQDPLVQFP